VCTAACVAGYTGSVSSTCSSTGAWSPVQGACTQGAQERAHCCWEVHHICSNCCNSTNQQLQTCKRAMHLAL
jgi:hypothetical protein